MPKNGFNDKLHEQIDALSMVASIGPLLASEHSNNYKNKVTWEAKWTQTNMRFHFVWKSHFGVQSALYLCSHELRRNEPQNGMDFISVILTKMKSQTGMRFSCDHNLPEMKLISAGSLDVTFNAHVRLKQAQCGYGFYIGHFERNEISFRVINIM